jgi:hypothetical protein
MVGQPPTNMYITHEIFPFSQNVPTLAGRVADFLWHDLDDVRQALRRYFLKVGDFSSNVWNHGILTNIFHGEILNIYICKYM